MSSLHICVDFARNISWSIQSKATSRAKTPGSHLQIVVENIEKLGDSETDVNINGKMSSFIWYKKTLFYDLCKD